MEMIFGDNIDRTRTEIEQLTTEIRKATSELDLVRAELDLYNHPGWQRCADEVFPREMGRLDAIRRSPDKNPLDIDPVLFRVEQAFIAGQQAEVMRFMQAKSHTIARQFQLETKVATDNEKLNRLVAKLEKRKHA